MIAPTEPALLGFKLDEARRVVHFVRQAVRGHRLFIATVFLLFAIVGGLAAAFLPRTYSANVRLLAKKNFLMPALVDPQRAVPFGAEAPAQSATELIMDRSAVLAVVRSANLVASWEKDRPAIFRWKDAARKRLVGAPSTEDMEGAITELLLTRLRVNVQEDVIAVRVTWWSPDAAVAILNQTIARFMTARRRLDISTIQASRDVLAASVAELRPVVERRVVEYGERRRHAQGIRTALIERYGGSSSLEDLRAQILSRRLDREEVARKRRERRAELSMQLAEREATLGPLHPDLADTRDALARLDSDDDGSSDVPEADAALQAQFEAAGGSAAALDDEKGARDRLAVPVVNPDEDETVIFARAMLRIEVDQYERLVGRLQNAELELSIARAAESFRYTVTSAPQLPKKPDSPNVMMVVVGALMAGAMAGVLGAVALDLLAAGTGGRRWIRNRPAARAEAA